MSTRHAGRSYLITGATSGLGRAVAGHLSGEGARIWALGTTEAGVDAVVGAGAAIGGSACDITDNDAVQRAVDAAVDALGKLDGGFVNAGIDGDGEPALTSSSSHFLRVLDVNVRGVFISARCIAGHILASQGTDTAGSIVINASVNGVRPEVNFASYNASKAAAISLAQTFALEWAPRIAVTAVAPGYFPTRMTEPYLGDADLADELLAHIPARRFGDPAELGALVSYLLSPEAAYLTGGCINIDGGRHV